MRDQVSTNSGLLAEICIEHAAGNWEVKNALCRGTRRCFARIAHDGPLESIAFLDTWVVSTGDGARTSDFAPQPEVCLRFAGGKRVVAAPSAATTTATSNGAAASRATPHRLADDGIVALDLDGSEAQADEEPFAAVLCDFFEFFEIAGTGQMDTNLIAPSLQALDLEEHEHIVCGCLHQYAHSHPSSTSHPTSIVFILTDCRCRYGNGAFLSQQRLAQIASTSSLLRASIRHITRHLNSLDSHNVFATISQQSQANSDAECRAQMWREALKADLIEKLSQRQQADTPVPKVRDAEELRAAALGDMYMLENEATASEKKGSPGASAVAEMQRTLRVFYATTNTDAPLERDAVNAREE